MSILHGSVTFTVQTPTGRETHRRLVLFPAGARRISVGGALTWVAVEAMAKAAEEIRNAGDFSSLTLYEKVDDWLGA